jgi:phytoene synthase
MSIHTWENSLIARATDVLNIPSQQHDDPATIEQDILKGAYEEAEQITRINSRTFHMAASLLPAAKRRNAYALYAFCRLTDDIVDEAPDPQIAAAALEDWRHHMRSLHSRRQNAALIAWADTRRRYDIPQGYAEQLVDGVARDLSTTRYATFADLAEYCYGVASTVGLMVMHIIGYKNRDAIEYAVKLGVALQLTNILRDVAEDWDMGRLYLPQSELRTFGITEDDIANKRLTNRWRKFMCFQIERTRGLYAEAEPGYALLAPDGRFSIMAAAGLYAGILDDIEANDYDVFNRRAHLSTGGKLKRLPKIWLRSKTRR